MMGKVYVYTMHRINGDVTQWQCVERNSCNARAYLVRSLQTKRIAEHILHTSNINDFIVMKLKQELGKSFGNTRTNNSIVASELSNLCEESAVYLPKLDILKKTIRM